MTETSPASSRYWINRALFDLGEAANREALAADKEGYVARYPLDEADRAALIRPGWRDLIDRGALPNLVFKYFMLHGLAPENFAAAAKEDRNG